MKNINSFSGQILIVFVALIGLSSCSTVKIVSDKDNTIDFNKYKTYQYYGWAEESDKLLNDLEQKRIEYAFGVELDKRGLSFAEENGDLMITLFIVTEQKTKTTATTTHMGGGYGYGYGYGGFYGYGPAYGWGAASSHTTYSDYDYVVGTLIIDVYDMKDKRLIWEAVAKGNVNENPKGQEDRINKLVARMMQEYPVEPSE